ncbi:MAG: hypothetical protein Q4C58_04950 [Eubacteriales bacterium]|nr:hypothetical protein [Eubacteriales bacterium]MDO4332018.1 hypothetical protein [Eubacteriales bacterium]
MAEQVKVIREYKDTVFRMLYRDKKELLQLYNALNETTYNNPEDLEVCTLENAIFMNVKNDVSFLLDSVLSLYEQQSSFNPNMPLRDLIYVSRQLEKYVRRESIYSSKLIRIPAPRFVVFYNGTSLQPERKILKLSDSFKSNNNEPELELKVLMLNINLGHNKELLEKCKTLKEYCIYVDRVRNYAKEMSIEDAVRLTVDECIRDGILSDFLAAQKAEVIAMSIFEYNEEIEMKKIREDEYNLGKAEGETIGRNTGIEEVINVLISTYAELGFSKEDTILKISEKFSIPFQKASEYVTRFWK